MSVQLDSAVSAFIGLSHEQLEDALLNRTLIKGFFICSLLWTERGLKTLVITNAYVQVTLHADGSYEYEVNR